MQRLALLILLLISLMTFNISFAEDEMSPEACRGLLEWTHSFPLITDKLTKSSQDEAKTISGFIEVCRENNLKSLVDNTLFTCLSHCHSSLDYYPTTEAEINQEKDKRLLYCVDSCVKNR